MAKPEWGMKRSCQSCGAKFYDLRKPQIVCPKCGTGFDPQIVTRPQRQRSVPVPAPVPAPVEEADVEEADVELEEEEGEEEDEVIEDASELGGDKDDMFEVIEKPEGEDER